MLKASVRKDDLFARFGGEEFAIVMPETERQDALVVAEHIRKQVETHPFKYGTAQYQVTVSLGVAATNGENWLTTSEFIRQADENLYQAKKQGRNVVIG